jgi:hypothetical protein
VAVAIEGGASDATGVATVPTAGEHVVRLRRTSPDGAPTAVRRVRLARVGD